MSKLFIVTADKIADTGTVSWAFMFKCGLSNKQLNTIIGLPYGHVWQPDKKENHYAFNVFKSGKGLEVAGGWSEYDTPDWEQKMAEAIPSSILLMTTTVFNWMKASILDKYAIEHERHHCEKILATS